MERCSARMLRVTFSGSDLAGMTVDQPAASVRLLLPSPGSDSLVVPVWNGNEFLLPDGQRPALRTFTPQLVTPDSTEIELDVVLHESGVATDWAKTATVGDPAAISGPGRGYAIDTEAAAYLLAGDEAAIPAIRQLLAAMPSHMAVQVHIEVVEPDARLDLSADGVAVHWHDLAPHALPGDALVAALRATDIAEDARIWAAGEAASMQRIRRLYFEDRSFPRAQTSIRGYWKHGRSEDPTDG